MSTLSDVGLLFSTRHALATEAQRICQKRGLACTAHNIVVALDSLGVLDRAKIRDNFARTGTTIRVQGDET